jgi:uncharacterized protein
MSRIKEGDISLEKISEILKENDPSLSKKFEGLCKSIRSYGSAVVAFSGGVDSALLAFLSSRLLPKTLCVTSDSPTLPRSELEDAKKFADIHELDLRVISYNELDDDRFVLNDEKRCYYCKDGLFKSLKVIQEKEGYDIILDGSNFDDLGDFRPGRDAEKEHGIKSPFVDAKIGKEEIRVLSKLFGLSTWDKPQMACLSSRVARGLDITDEKLKQIEISEKMIKDLGYKDVRVRHHGIIARIEIGKDEKIDLEGLKAVLPQIKKQRFKYVVLDLEGYRTGSLNE